jgi:hypothetical protein
LMAAMPSRSAFSPSVTGSDPGSISKVVIGKTQRRL